MVRNRGDEIWPDVRKTNKQKNNKNSCERAKKLRWNRSHKILKSFLAMVVENLNRI